MTSGIAVLVIATNAADPSTPVPPGSKLKKGLMDYLPNFAEVNLVVSMANVYMQASSMVRTVNASIHSMQTAVDNLEEARATADKLWGDVQRLQDINIYDMDSWAAGLSTLRYEVLELGMIGMNRLLTSSAINMLDGTIGGYVKAENGLSYDAREIGLDHAFTAYYYQEDWADYKSKNGFDHQTKTVQDKLDNLESLREQKEALRNWTCPEGMSAADCDKVITLNMQQVKNIDNSMDQVDADIASLTDKVSVGQLQKNSSYLQLDYLETALRRVHLSSEEYAKAYQQINEASAQLAKKAQKLLTGRLTTPKRDPQPRPAKDLSAPSEAELCSRPENIVTKPDGSQSCIYSEKDKNKSALPTEKYDPSDLFAVDPDHEKPRDPSQSDFQKIKVEIAFLSLQQEQLLLDMEMDQAYLEIAQLMRKSTQIVDHRRKLRTIQEGLGMAAAIGQVNYFTTNEIRARHNSNLIPGNPWDMSQTLEANLVK